MGEWTFCQRDGVRLACQDFGGSGRSVLLLHGLAGHAGEWTQTAEALQDRYRIVALDQRGHDRSERKPPDVTRAAFVSDVTAVIEDLGLAPVSLVGQSMGANTAFLTAAARPDLVASLVVIEASPDGPTPELPDHIRRWLDSWPLPFAHRGAAVEFFTSQGLVGDAWADGLERRTDGLWPAFDPEVMVDCIADLAARDYWTEWRQINCPTLIVRGEQGNLPAEHASQLAHALPNGRVAEIPHARHDVHLEAPTKWIRELDAFLATAAAGPLPQ